MPRVARVLPNLDWTPGAGLLAILAAALLMFAASARAQTPNISQTGLPLSVFGGTQFCFSASLTNTGPPGFGPYLLVVLPPEVSFDSANAFGVSADNVVSTFDGSGVLADPVSGQNVNGPPGGTLVLSKPPVGSVVQNGPPIDIEVCSTLAVNATIGLPLAIDLFSGYEFGDTPTGANGPIIDTGTPLGSTVTPTLAVLDKTNTAPEAERPPGPDWPFDYVLTLKVSPAATLDNVVFTDTLPPQVQWTGAPIVFNAATGAGCQIDQNPNPPPVPGGTFLASCTSVAGTGGVDATISIPVYITDILDESSVDSRLLSNTVGVSYGFQSAPFSDTASTDVTAMHGAIQKGVNPSSVVPQDTATYTSHFQITDYGNINQVLPGGFTVVDVLPDGLLFNNDTVLTVDGTQVAITPSVQLNVPGPGQTTITWDVAAAVLTATLPGVALDAGTAGSLRYTAEVLHAYADGQPLRANDSLSNTIDLDYMLVEGGSGSNGSGATIGIPQVALSKSIIDPSPVPALFGPTDNLTYRLTLSIPSGDAQNIRIQDFFPLPVIDVSDPTSFDPTVGGGVNIATPPDTGDATIQNVIVDAATNSVAIDFSDVDTDPTRPAVISVDLTVTLVDKPHADKLFLTNIAQTSTDNTVLESTSDLAPVDMKVGAPLMAITKGVHTVSNSSASISPAPPSNPAVARNDSDLSGADAGDSITFVLTVENIGSKPAHRVTVTDPGAAGLTCATSTAALIVQDGDGNPLAASGDLATGLVITPPLTANDGGPTGGGAPFSTDTALIFVDCTLDDTVEPGTSVTNSASAIWFSAATATVPFPAVSDDATTGIAEPTMSKRIDAIAPNVGLTGNNATIGSIITYTVDVTVPQGTSNGVTLVDTLENGLAIVDCLSVSVPGGVTITPPPGFAALNAACSNIGTTANSSNPLISPLNTSAASGRTASFELGTVQVAGNGGASTAVVSVTYSVVVLNSTGNNQGAQNTNSAVWASATSTVSDSAPEVTVSEPSLSVAKDFDPATGDAGDTVMVTITVSSAGGARPEADQVVLQDLLPAELIFAGNLQVGACDTSPDPGFPSQSGGTVDASWSTFPAGESCEVTFDVSIDPSTPFGTSVQNDATIDWSSLPGDITGISPFNDFDSERTSAAGVGTGEGASDDYDATGSATFSVAAVVVDKSILSTSETTTASDQHDNAVVDLTIGETVSYEILVTVPEGTAPNFTLTETLPATPGRLRLVSVDTFAIGANISPQTPTPVISGDEVTMDFPAGISNTPDGVVTADDQIRLVVTAVLTDQDTPNVNKPDDVVNVARADYNNALSAVGSVAIEIVEPELNVTKSPTPSSAEAGTLLTYEVIVSHTGNSAADAVDVVLNDVLPAVLNYEPGSLSFDGAAPTATCSVAPTLDDTNPQGSGLTASFADLPLGEGCVISYQTRPDVTATLGSTIANRVDLDYSSAENDLESEGRDYLGNAQASVVLSEPGVNKAVTSTDIAETSNVVLGSESDLTIGEQVTYQITVDLPNGTLENTVLIDELPNGVNGTLAFVNAVITAVGDDISIGSGLRAGDSPSGFADSAPLDGLDDRATWNLGQVLNATTDAAPEDDEIVITITAIVLDTSGNKVAGGVDNATNTGRIQFEVAGSPQERLDTALVDIVNPELQITKTPDGVIVDGADVVTYSLLIEHTGNSSATAFDIDISDVLPSPGASWIDDSTVSGSVGCGTVSVDSSAEPTIALATDPLSPGSTCTISYDVAIDGGLTVGQTFSNTATLQWDSTPAAASRENASSTSVDTGSFNLSEPSLVKQTTTTSNPDTGTAAGDPTLEDLAVGEIVCYGLSAFFPEGDTGNAVLIDEAPAGIANGAAGILNITSAIIQDTGSLSFTGTGNVLITDDLGADGFDDTVTIDFETVSNTTNDNVVNELDRVLVEVCGEVVDVLDAAEPDNSNEAGDLLSNAATLSFDGGSQQDSADIEVIEPLLSISKTFIDVSGGIAAVQLDVENFGDAPAYDVAIDDVLDDTRWDTTTITAGVIPSGFMFSTQPGPGAGETTASILSDPSASSPDASVEPGERLSFTFNAALATPLPSPPVSNDANLSGDTMPGIVIEERRATDTDSADVDFPSLTATKVDTLNDDADSSGNVSGGDTLTYTVEISNVGSADANNVVLRDTPDTNSTLVAGSVTATGTVTIGNAAGDAAIEVSFPSIAPGNSVSITYQVMVNTPVALGVSELLNQGIVSSDELPDIATDDPDAGNPGTDPTVVPVTRVADLAATKLGASPIAIPGATFSYQVSIVNNGPDPVDDGTASDPAFPSALSNTAWTCVSSTGSVCTPGPVSAGNISDGPLTILPGGLLGYTITGSVHAAAAADLFNAVDVSSPGTQDPLPGNNSDQETTPLVASADLIVSKSTTALSLSPGELVTYTITVSNNGPSDAVNLAISDPLPLGTRFVSSVQTSPPGGDCAAGFAPACTDIARLASGASVTWDLTVRVDNPYTGPASLLNDVAVGSSTPDPVPGNNDDSVTTPVGGGAVADLSLVKSGPPSAALGSTVTFTIDITNAGPNDAQNAVLTDPIAPGLSFSSANPNCIDDTLDVVCALGTVRVGQTVPVTINFAIPAGYSGPDPIENSAVVTSATADLNPNNNTDDASVPLGVDAVELVVTKTGITIATPGDTVVYTVLVENLGPGDASNVTLDDTTPAGLTYNDGASSAACGPDGVNTQCLLGSISTGASSSVSIAFDIPPGYDTSIDPIVNLASARADQSEAILANNTDRAATGINGSEPADLLLIKSGPAAPAADGLATFSLVVSNLGTGVATNVVVSDPIPAGLSYAGGASDPRCNQAGGPGSEISCGLGDLAPGSSANLDIALLAPLDFAGGGPIVNIATVSSDAPEPDTSNNTDSHSVAAPRADLAVTKTAEASSSSPGGTISYLLNVTNNGPQTARAITVSDPTPAGLTLLSVDTVSPAEPAVCAGGLTPCTDISGLRLGESITLRATYRLAAPFIDGSVVTNTVSVAAQHPPDPEPINDTAEASTPVILEPLGLAKSLEEVVFEPGPCATCTSDDAYRVTYLVTAGNFTPFQVTDFQVSDNLASTFGAVPFRVERVLSDIFAVNDRFDGITDTRLLESNPAQILPAGPDLRTEIRIVVRVFAQVSGGTYLNRVFGSGEQFGVPVGDTSVDGIDPDPDGTGPGNHESPTQLEIGRIAGIPSLSSLGLVLLTALLALVGAAGTLRGLSGDSRFGNR